MGMSAGAAVGPPSFLAAGRVNEKVPGRGHGCDEGLVSPGWGGEDGG